MTFAEFVAKHRILDLGPPEVCSPWFDIMDALMFASARPRDACVEDTLRAARRAAGVGRTPSAECESMLRRLWSLYDLACSGTTVAFLPCPPAAGRRKI